MMLLLLFIELHSYEVGLLQFLVAPLSFTGAFLPGLKLMSVANIVFLK